MKLRTQQNTNTTNKIARFGSVRFGSVRYGAVARFRRVYRNLSDTDITAMCLDFRQRKFILGDHNGTLNCYDFLNGANMKDFAYESCDGKAHHHR